MTQKNPDPIKAALDAAADAYASDVLDLVSRQGIAAAVAAFLRALPVAEGQVLHHVLLSPSVVESLAAIVDRTAAEP